MSKGKGWDLSSTRSMEAGAEWMRKNAGALLVLIVRAEDIGFAVDAQIAPADAREMVELVMPQVEERLRAQRVEARRQAELKAIGKVGR